MSLEGVKSPHAVQDHYENLYAVISGLKTFFLLPPSDAYRLSIRRYPVAQYERDSNGKLELWLKQPIEARPACCPSPHHGGHQWLVDSP